MKTDIMQLVQKYALQNAIQYGGVANAGSVIGKILAKRPELKLNVRELVQIVDRIVKNVNELPLSEQKKILDKIWPEVMIERDKPEVRELPPLPNVEEYPFVHVRFCPNPDGALHLGGARAAILCDEYAKMYSGRFTLRFDDSDPRTKSPIPEAYNWIVRDLEWLGVRWHSTIYQSDRLEIYYDYAKKLLEMNFAYVCRCKPKEFRKLVLDRNPCPCRDMSPEEHLARWDRMLKGDFDEGEAVVRIKTDLYHPNPAVRDWPALRIINTEKYPHPRNGNKYRVWPLFAFCCGIDDHDLQISHIIRGKEHLTNTVRQLFLYDYFRWKYPEAIHYGRFKIVGGVLSKSKIREGIANGLYTGWDDPRLGTLMALKRRGFLPETVRKLILETGPKPVDVTISWVNIEAMNRRLLDPIANRYFFVSDPIKLIVNNVGRDYTLKLPLHPRNHEKGGRLIEVKPKHGSVSIMISKDDLKLLKTDKIVRLMGLFNFTIKSVEGQIEGNYHSDSYVEAKRIGARLIHWIPYGTGIKTLIVMPNKLTLQGFAENSCQTLNTGDIVQFERFGFVRIDNVTGDKIVAYYAHR